MLNPATIWHKQQICPPHLSNVEPLYLGKSKKSLFNITIHILRIIYLTSEENNCCTGRFFRTRCTDVAATASFAWCMIGSQHDNVMSHTVTTYHQQSVWRPSRRQPVPANNRRKVVECNLQWWPLHGLVNLWQTEVYPFKQRGCSLSEISLTWCTPYCPVPSVLRHCWLGVRNSIRPEKNKWPGVGAVICLERGVDCLHKVQLMPLHPKTPSSLASFKSRLVFTARCYASAVLAMALCPSVCLSVRHKSESY